MGAGAGGKQGAPGAGSGAPRGPGEGGRGRHRWASVPWLLRHPARAHSAPEGELPGERAPNPRAKPRGRLRMGELAPEGSRRPTAPRAQAPRAAPHLLLGCSRLCRYMKFTSSLLMSLHLKREGTGAAVSSRRPPRCADRASPRRPLTACGWETVCASRTSSAAGAFWLPCRTAA